MWFAFRGFSKLFVAPVVSLSKVLKLQNKKGHFEAVTLDLYGSALARSRT